MGNYVPGTPAEQQEMLREIGFSGFDDLYRDIPDSVKLKKPLGLTMIWSLNSMSTVLSANAIFLVALISD